MTPHTIPDLLDYIRRTGRHSERKPGPVTVLVAGESKTTILPLMTAMRAVFLDSEVCLQINRGEPCPVQYQEGYGFRGKPPRLYFHAGPGVGSRVSFQTYGTGPIPMRLAGITVDLVVIPAVPSERVRDELLARVVRRGGEVWVVDPAVAAHPHVRALEVVSRLLDVIKSTAAGHDVSDFLDLTRTEYADVFEAAEEHVRATLAEAGE